MPEKSESKQINIKYEVDYRNVKYSRLEYKTGDLLLILPKEYHDEKTILNKHRKWITRKEQAIRQALEAAEKKALNMDRTEDDLKKLVHSAVKKYEKDSRFYVNRIFFRKMRTKWASYSSQRNLTINTLIRYLSIELIEYIIFHEMVHSIERKHNKRFWKIITEKFNDYPTREKDLLVYWFTIQKQLCTARVIG